MNNQINKMPKRRFPEFLNAGAWEVKMLGTLIDIKGRIGYRGYTIDDIVKKGEGAISLSPSNIYDDGYLTFEKSTYITWDKYEESPEIILKDGFTVLVKTGSTYGKVALINKLPEKATINPQLVVLKPIQIDSVFLFLTISNQSVQKQIKKAVVGGAIPTLSQDSIAKFEILIPSKAEQQKIATCLSSLDEWIAAQTEQVAALQLHKKGMLQQLFPAAGETVPRLRFPAFEENGEWEITVLDKIACFVKEKVPLETLQLATYISTENLLPNYEGVVTASKLPSSGSFTKFRKADVLISNIRPYLKKVWTATVEGAASNDVIVIRADLLVTASFLSYLLKNDAFINYVMESAQGVKMPRGDKALMEEYSVTFPKNKAEQQQIAACLSAIDARIAAATEQLAALKMHKKGLMQQLFPNVGA